MQQQDSKEKWICGASMCSISWEQYKEKALFLSIKEKEIKVLYWTTANTIQQSSHRIFSQIYIWAWELNLKILFSFIIRMQMKWSLNVKTLRIVAFALVSECWLMFTRCTMEKGKGMMQQVWFWPQRLSECQVQNHMSRVKVLIFQTQAVVWCKPHLQSLNIFSELFIRFFLPELEHLRFFNIEKSLF